MQNALFVVLMVSIALGLVLLGGMVYHLKRSESFEQMMTKSEDGKSSPGRLFFIGAAICFAIAWGISWVD
ncbi:MAG: hypothetical protein ACYTGQ_01540 [Planctomycetota bacterium]|jgi:hypothetical protein